MERTGLKRKAISSLGTLAIHAGIFALVAMLEPPPPPDSKPVEVSVIPVPAPAEEPLVPDLEPSLTPVPEPHPRTTGGSRRRAAASTSAASPAGETSPSASSEVAVSPESSAPPGPEDVGTAGPGPAGGGMPVGTGPVPLADYSEVALPVAPALLGKFAEREIVLDLYVDQDGRVQRTTRLEGVDGRVDQAVADVSRQFRFVPATDGQGHAMPGVVTYKFKVRALDPRRPSRPLLSPLLASVGLRGVSAGGRDLPVAQEPAPAPEPSPEQRKVGRTLARGIAGTLFGGGEAVLAPSRSKSGLPRSRRVGQLSRTDKEKFCKWAVAVQGGEGHATDARFPEDRTIDDAAGRHRWYEGATSRDGSQTWKPSWWGLGSLNDESFMGRFVSQERHRAFNPRNIADLGLDPVEAIEVQSGRKNGAMEGPERVAVVQSEAVCVAELDEVAVCTVTVAQVEACVDAMVLDPALGGESPACVIVRRCGAPVR